MKICKENFDVFFQVVCIPAKESSFIMVGIPFSLAYTVTRQKTPSPLLNRIEQCFAAHVVQTCQQY